MGATATTAENRTYTCRGQTFATEREMLLAMMDGFRAAEAFGAESLRVWVGACRIPVLRGGLRTIVEREAWHARALAQRLTEIGGTCQAEVPAAVRETALTRLAAADVGDIDKLRDVVGFLNGQSDPVGGLRQAALQVEEDQESRGLLMSMLDDEDATVRWFRETCASLTQAA